MLDKIKDKQVAVISAPNFQSAKIRLTGMAPYVMNRMSSENRQKIIEKQQSGARSKKGEKRAPKDFDKIYRGTMHVSQDGWNGIPASSIRAAMVAACSIVGFHMTMAKKCLFVEADGFDQEDGQPLIKIVGKPIRRDMAVKLADGSTDIIPRAFFDKWHADVTITWDADIFSASDVLNVLARAGKQIGIGAGRPFSKNSCGMGWGIWRIES